MNIFFLTALAFAAAPFVLPLAARPATPIYQFVPGQTLRYLIQRDPYFADPKGAMEADDPDAPYLAPSVERLTEKVLSVGADGEATLSVTLTPEPGFEDDAHPQAPLTRTVTVTAAGRVLSVSGGPIGESAAERDLLRGFAALPPGAAARPDGLSVTTQTRPAVVARSTSPDHDGTLLQTTSAAQTDHIVFDCRRGQLVREVSTETITMSLVMTGRGRRGSDDFGHVIPNTHVIQTLSVERQAD